MIDMDTIQEDVRSFWNSTNHLEEMYDEKVYLEGRYNCTMTQEQYQDMLRKCSKPKRSAVTELKKYLYVKYPNLFTLPQDRIAQVLKYSVDKRMSAHLWGIKNLSRKMTTVTIPAEYKDAIMQIVKLMSNANYTALADSGLPYKYVKLLKEENIDTLEELAEVPRQDLLNIPGIGNGALIEIEAILREKNLR